ncbi:MULTISPECIES: hypothetical protein [unclassified Rhizobium]|uniref:hypothetical protein n=1 Tax=unclassified Rhizobium TaxID=2613769 RepID=UPI00140474B3|nr:MULTISPECIES: hypothetical protein [unclassified Rhizobium]MBB3398690.1 hypothetical protein [Rhizobium sp. BK060]
MATTAAIALPRRMAIFPAVRAWLGNQAIGYFVLSYPQTWDSYAWGFAIGVAATASVFAVFAVLGFGIAFAVRTIVAFLAVFVACERILFAATALLPSGDGAFSIAVVAQVLTINAVAALALGAAHILGWASQLLFEKSPQPILR